MKVLVLYVFHQYHSRVQHFIKRAIFQDESIDFLVVCNHLNPELNPTSLELPSYVKWMKRDNLGYDFGAWSDALLTNDLYKQYDQFIFVNSSVMGPYTPSYYKGKWTDIYLQGLHGNVKLFGSTINTCTQPATLSHVQSYIFSMDRNTLEYLIECQIFSTTFLTSFEEVVYQKEIRMSRKVIEKGWNIGSLLECYKDVDFTRTEHTIPILEDIMLPCFEGDFMYPYFRGKVWTEHQLCFIKGNRVHLKY